jgi:general secretion pathway protein F
MSASPDPERGAHLSVGAVQAEIQVRVRLADGRVQSVAIKANSEADAVRKACARGLQIVAIDAATTPLRKGSASERRFPLMLFSQELLALLESGLNLTEALSALVAKQRQGNTRDTLRSVLDELREGRSFSDTLEERATMFPAVFVATVRASERTGDLPISLSRYIAYQVQFETIRKKLISASIYPSLLLIVGACVSLFLMGYVVPRFSAMYESTGHDMPWLSARLLDFGRFVHANWVLTFSGLVAVVLVAILALSQPRLRTWLLDSSLRMPGLSAKATQYRSARFMRAISLLLSAGIPLSRALTMVDGLLGPSQQMALVELRRHISEGKPLSTALAAVGLGDPIADSLIKVGERSGQLALMLERSARFYDDAFGRWLDWSSRLLEPLLMIFIGGVIGTIVVLMYMPIFELAGSLQ